MTNTYRIISLCMIVVLCSCSHLQEGMIDECSYYLNNESVYYRYSYLSSDTIKKEFKAYYNDGSLMETGKYIKTKLGKWVGYGEYRHYYKDGFLKESYKCDSSGVELCPRETGIMGGYKIIVDIDTSIFHQAMYQQDSVSFHQMRICVENIPMGHYWIGLKDKGRDFYYEIPRLNTEIRKYAMCNTLEHDAKDTFYVEIDESLYHYAITDWHDKDCAIDSMGMRGYVFGIYFADTTGYVGTEPKQTIFVPFDFHKNK